MRSQTSDQSQPLAEVSIALPATAEHLAEVYATLARFWSALEASHPTPPDGTWRAYFDTAVGEIVANIVRYAYAAPCAGEMSIALRGFRDRVEATLQDRGVPYDATSPGESSVACDEADVLDLPEGGWGLAMTLAAVDELRYTREADVNFWRLMKKL